MAFENKVEQDIENIDPVVVQTAYEEEKARLLETPITPLTDDVMGGFQNRLEDRVVQTSPAMQYFNNYKAQQVIEEVDEQEELAPSIMGKTIREPEVDAFTQIYALDAQEPQPVQEVQPEVDKPLLQEGWDLLPKGGQQVVWPFIAPFVKGSVEENPIVRGITEGVLHDAPQGIVDLSRDVVNALGGEFKEEDWAKLPQILESNPDSITEGVVRGLSQFMSIFGAAGGIGKGATLFKQMMAGGLADATFDPTGGNLATLLRELDVDNALTQFLDSKVGEDADALERLTARGKHVLEGAGIGFAVPTLIAGLRWAKNSGAPWIKEFLQDSDPNLVPKTLEKFGIDMPEKELFGGTKGAENLGKTDSLNKAEKLEKEGASKEDIWKYTGFVRGQDDKWRFELDDSKLRIKDSFRKKIKEKGVDTTSTGPSWSSKLDEVIDYPELFIAYPELKNLNFTLDGRLKPGAGEFLWDTQKYVDGTPSLNLSKINVSPESDLRNIGTHEIQHAIQTLEGHARGSSAGRETFYMLQENKKYQSLQKKKADLEAQAKPLRDYIKKTKGQPYTDERGTKVSELNKIRDDLEGINNEIYDIEKSVTSVHGQNQAWKNYRNTAGEAEAREAQKRLNLSNSERHSLIPRWAGVSDEDAILRFDESFVQNMNKSESKLDDGVLGQTKETDPMIVQHNLSEIGVDIADEIGGIPMPSMAVSKVDSPLTDFGDITLVGDKTLATPARRNFVYSSDTYTGSQPSRFMAFTDVEKVADDIMNRADIKHFGDNYMFDLSSDYIDKEEIYKKLARIDAMAAKGYKTTDYDRYADMEKAFFKENPDESRWYFHVDYQINPEDLGEVEAVFTSSSGKNLPYTKENVLRQMEKNKAWKPATESGTLGSPTGRKRAVTAKKFTNIKQVEAAREKIIPEAKFQELAQSVQDKEFRVAEAIVKLDEIDKRTSGQWGFGHDLSHELMETVLSGKSIDDYGFSAETNKQLLELINPLKDMMKDMPTKYFEIKPRDIKQLSDFKGAIVPAYAREAKKLLKKAGIKKIYTYGTEEERKELFKKFPELMFAKVAVPTSIGAGAIQVKDADAKEKNTASDFIKGFESYKGQGHYATKAEAKEGLVSVGYGSTHKVKHGEKITKEQAEKWLKEDIKKATQTVDRLVKIELNNNQKNALISLVYNVGAGNFKKSKALKALNSGNIETFLKEAFDPKIGFVKNRAGGRILKGLVNRRAAEKELFLKGTK